MKKLFEAYVARALNAQSDAEWEALCGDTDRAFDADKITWQEHELVFRLINRLWCNYLDKAVIK